MRACMPTDQLALILDLFPLAPDLGPYTAGLGSWVRGLGLGFGVMVTITLTRDPYPRDITCVWYLCV